MNNRDSATDRNLLGIILMIAGVFVISVEDAGSKFLMEADLHAFQIISISAWLSVAALAIWSVVDRKRNPIGIRTFKTKHWRIHLLRSALSVVTGLFFLYALKYMKLADVTIIFFSAPIMMTAMSALILKEKVGLFRWTAVIAGFIGVMIALRPEADDVDWKILLPLFGSMTYAGRAVLIRSMAGVETATQIVFHTRLGVALLSTGPLIFFWVPMSLPHFYLLTFLTGLLLIAHLLMTKATVTASLAVVGPFEYTGLLWSVLLGFVIWGDLPGQNMWIGAVFIIGSGLVVAYREGLLKKTR